MRSKEIIGYEGLYTISENDIHAIKMGLKSGSVGKKFANNKSGYVGVSLQRSTGKWKSQIRYKGNLIYLGLYKTPSDASDAYQKKFQELYEGLCYGLV